MRSAVELREQIIAERRPLVQQVTAGKPVPVAVSRLRGVRRRVADRSRISDSSHIKDRDRPGKIYIRHMTKRACLISVDRELLVKKHELPESLYTLHAASDIAWDRGQLRQSFGEDPVNFSLHPLYLFFQPRQRRILWRAIRRRKAMRDDKQPEHERANY